MPARTAFRIAVILESIEGSAKLQRMSSRHDRKIVRELKVVKEKLLRIRPISAGGGKSSRRNFAEVFALDERETSACVWHHFLGLGLIPTKAHLVNHLG